MSRSPTIIDDEDISTDPAEWLPNEHAGEVLQSEFLEPLSMSPATLADLIGVEAARIENVVSGRAAVDADLDLRLARYFAMSQGFFMRVQVAYELLERKRALGRSLDRIIPRAA